MDAQTSRGWWLLLSHVLMLMLMLACPGHTHRALDYPSFTDISDPQPDVYRKRYDDFSYDSFIGLMGRRSAGTKRDADQPGRGDMNDVFVGLLGRRNKFSEIPAWKRERRENSFTKRRHESPFGWFHARV